MARYTDGQARDLEAGCDSSLDIVRDTVRETQCRGAELCVAAGVRASAAAARSAAAAANHVASTVSNGACRAGFTTLAAFDGRYAVAIDNLAAGLASHHPPSRGLGRQIAALRRESDAMIQQAQQHVAPCAPAG
jgi:hypothetical protein